MNFHITPHEGYVVKVSEGVLTDNGQDAAGLSDWGRHLVWLANEKQLPVQRRSETLAHELWHQWKAKFGAPADEESEANLVAAFAVWFMHELEVVGGELALMRLGPDGIINKAADIEEPFSRWEPRCPACQGYLDLPIRASKPRHDARLKRLVVIRTAYCDFCGHDWSWPEASTIAGAPTGNPLGPMIKVSDHAAAAAS